MRVLAHSVTNTGHRPQNEDANLVAAELGLFVVADGMGGYAGGEVAATLAVDIVHGKFLEAARSDWVEPGRTGRRFERRMVAAFRAAHHEVAQERVGPLAEMGTTMSAIHIDGAWAVIGHVGDSRIYRLRAGIMEQLTRDHSLLAELEAAGLESVPVAARAFGHVITRAIGVPDTADPDVRRVRVQEGDVFLLCTDGVTDVVDAKRLATVLETLPPRLAAAAIVTDAWMSGSNDNMTAVVVRVESDDPAWATETEPPPPPEGPN